MIPRRSLTLDVALVALACVAFALASLWPWMHLVTPVYLVIFSAFTGLLGAVALGLTRLLGRFLWRAPLLAPALATGAVFLPVWAWNGVGDVDVVVVHLDGFRADHGSLYGYARPTTPGLERLEQEGAVVFEHFFAQSPDPRQATAALLAGVYPSMVHDPESGQAGGAFVLPERFRYLGECVRGAGRTSYGVTGSPLVNRDMDLQRGFDELEEIWFGDPRPADVVEDLLERIAITREPGLFVGVVDGPTAPFDPPPAHHVFASDAEVDWDRVMEGMGSGDRLADWEQALVDLYDGEIREADAAVTDLVEGLEELGRLERTLLVVTAAHGEELLDHGRIGHAGSMFEPVLRVPLVVRFPSPLRFPPLRPAATRVDALASQIDLAPTLLGFLGLPIPGQMQGTNLTPYLFGGLAPPGGPVLAEDVMSEPPTRALRTERWKLLLRRRPDGSWGRAFADLSMDPRELDLLAAEEVDPRAVKALEKRLRQTLAWNRHFRKAAGPR